MRLRCIVDGLVLTVFLAALANSAPNGRSTWVSRHVAFPQTSESDKCGTSVADIALCLHSSGDLELMLEIRNTGDEDQILNLGVIFSNGRQYPTAIKLTLTDSTGTKHEAKWGELMIIAGGRIDPLVLPLPSGASITLPMHLSKYVWLVSGQIEDFKPDPRQRYTAQAQFTGKAVSMADANLDMKGIALMPYWTGVVSSNRVKIGPVLHGNRN